MGENYFEIFLTERVPADFPALSSAHLIAHWTPIYMWRRFPMGIYR
jgi:hypothetical protein